MLWELKLCSSLHCGNLSILMQVCLGEVVFFISDPHDKLTWRGGAETYCLTLMIALEILKAYTHGHKVMLLNNILEADPSEVAVFCDRNMLSNINTSKMCLWNFWHL